MSSGRGEGRGEGEDGRERSVGWKRTPPPSTTTTTKSPIKRVGRGRKKVGMGGEMEEKEGGRGGEGRTLGRNQIKKVSWVILV